MLSPSTARISRQILEAAVVAAIPKAVGSVFRYKDAKNADPALKRNILKGEALTVAQVSIYSVLIDRAIKLMAKFAENTSKDAILRTCLTTLTAEKNKSLFLCALAALANYTAEKASRLKFKREIGPNNAALSDEKQTLNKTLNKTNPDSICALKFSVLV
jgi:hypothetical protein